MESNENIEQRIHAAARKLFIEKGYLNTNMSDIAVEAGIKRPTLHYYFRTKSVSSNPSTATFYKRSFPASTAFCLKTSPLSIA